MHVTDLAINQALGMRLAAAGSAHVLEMPDAHRRQPAGLGIGEALHQLLVGAERGLRLRRVELDILPQPRIGIARAQQRHRGQRVGRKIVGHPPEIHFGWSNENPMAANIGFLLFGEGNVPWMVRELILDAEPRPERQPRVIIG